MRALVEHGAPVGCGAARPELHAVKQRSAVEGVEEGALIVNQVPTPHPLHTVPLSRSKAEAGPANFCAQVLKRSVKVAWSQRCEG